MKAQVIVWKQDSLPLQVWDIHSVLLVPHRIDASLDPDGGAVPGLPDLDFALASLVEHRRGVLEG